MGSTTQRITDRIERDFGTQAPEVARRLEQLELPIARSLERVQAAVLLCSGADLRKFDAAMALAALDWRDLLVNAGLADEDWASRLEAELGPHSG